MRKTRVLFVVLLLMIIVSCSKSKKSLKVEIEPTERIINNLKGSDFSIVLNDMDIEDKKEHIVYKHKYHILKKIKDSLVIDSLGWKTVNEKFFLKYKEDLGMEIISSHDGVFSRIAKPVGFNWAIGNPKYGKWVKADSTKTSSRRVWRHRTPSLLFWYWMLRRPAYQRDYRASRAFNSSGKTYYGSNSRGTTKYGTQSTYQKTKRGSFYNRSRTSKAWKSFNNSKKGRSSSRYGKSSSRSRSGGYGK